MFKRLLLAGLLAGLVSGLVLSAIQYLQVIPIIQEAERYETAATVHQEHGIEEGWSPQEGWERMSFTPCRQYVHGDRLGLDACQRVFVTPAHFYNARYLLGGCGFFGVFHSPVARFAARIAGC